MTRLEPEEVRAFLETMPEGWYFSRDLFPAYISWAVKWDQTAPKTAKELGEAIAALNRFEKRKVGGRSQFHIGKVIEENGRDWFVEPKRDDQAEMPPDTRTMAT